MINTMNRFRRIARQTSLVKDERGLSTVEYVIILVLIAAAAVGTWSTFGSTITAKIKSADDEITGKVTVERGDGDGNGAQSKGDN